MITIVFTDLEHRNNQLEGKELRGAKEVSLALESCRRFAPFICELRASNGSNLLVGVGDPGFAQYSSADGSPPYLVTVSPEGESEGEVEFLASGTPTPIPRRNCTDWQAVLRTAEHFAESGDAWPDIRWEEV